MKLSIKTQVMELTYEDEYSNLTEDVKKRLIEIIKPLPIRYNNPVPVGVGGFGMSSNCETKHSPTESIKYHPTERELESIKIPTYVGTAENFFFSNSKDK